MTFSWGKYLVQGLPQTDVFGLDLSTHSRAAVSAVNRYFECVLRYGNDWAVALEAVTADPGFPLAHALAADFAMACEDVGEARACLARAEAARTPSERGRAYLDAMGLWAAGDVPGAAASFCAALARFPRDLFLLKRAQLLCFFLGDAPRMLECAAQPAVAAANDGRPYFHGMLAFALEQAGDLAAAEAQGRRATDIFVGDAWAHHAVAHALYFQGRLAEGVEWLLALAPHWETCCSFMLTHNWWHVALSHLDMDDMAAVARVYDSKVWGVNKLDVQDQLGALGMLLKWQLRCAATPELPAPGAERWADVIAHAQQKTQVHLDPLYDVLLVYGLCVVDDPQAAAFAAEAAKAASSDVVRQALQGALAFGTGRFAEAVPLLAERDALGLVGGSSEQRDVLEEVRLCALIRAGDLAGALALATRRNAERPGIGATERVLSSLTPAGAGGVVRAAEAAAPPPAKRIRA